MAANELIAHLPALSWMPIANATPTQVGIKSVSNVFAYSYNASIVEDLYTIGKLPNSFTSSANIVAQILWSTVSTVGNVVWQFFVVRVQDNALTLPSLPSDWTANTQLVAAASGTTENMIYDEVTIPNASLDGLQPGEEFFLILRRLATSGSDTVALDADFISLTLREA